MEVLVTIMALSGATGLSDKVRLQGNPHLAVWVMELMPGKVLI